MKLLMVNSLYFETRRERVVVVRYGATTEDMDLWLNRNGGSLGNAIDADTIMRCEERVSSMGEPSCRLFRIKTSLCKIWLSILGAILRTMLSACTAVEASAFPVAS